MAFSFTHVNFNVLDLSRSMEFYARAFDFREKRRLEASGFTLVYLTDGASDFELELTYLHERKEPYNLGEKEFHLALYTDDYAAARAKHADMDIICYENAEMGIYFVEDPDGYWIEVLPKNM
ncbi:VOC family protein [Selenomonas artemidis]|nr:VOC family protein [Selenomonas artemidis]MBF1682856.1 VOC family protein [Selenomonas artemidis]